MESKSKTPQFNKLLDTHLEHLVPHRRTCKWTGMHQHCEGEFEIEEGDIKFLKMLRVPAPNFCPTCRRIRRFSHMGLSQFFKIPCQAPGHTEQMISIFSEDCPFPVYDYKFFISDEFNPFVFGLDYTGEQSPLQMLFKMRKTFPMPSFLNRDLLSVNSEYSNGGRNTKNAYYTFGCFIDEDIWYCVMATNSKDVMDSRFASKSEHCYSLFHSEAMYKSSFTSFSKDCSDCMFLFDCRNCDNCFGCVNLRNKRYCVWNEQLSKEDYDAFLKSVFPLTRQKIREYESKLLELVKKLPINASRNSATENVSGVMLGNVRNSHDVTGSRSSENLRHADGGLSSHDAMDFTYAGKSNNLYGTINVGSQSSNMKFSISSKFCSNCEFVFNSKNLDSCFMCFGLQSKSYCILNKQYSKDEYYSIVDKIKSDMWEKGEYGDGFPIKFSAQAYNMSIASESFPLEEDEIVKLGGYLAKKPESNTGETQTLSGKEIPQTVEEVKDDIVDYGIVCEITKRPFRIIPSELGFYRRMKMPIPSVHPVVRMNNKAKTIPIGVKYMTSCANCKKQIYSAYDPKDGYILYCEDCFKKEVY